MKFAFYVPKELPRLSPGYYTIVSDAEFIWANAGTMIRLFWNVTVYGAPRLVGTITQQLNRHRVPFRMKVLSEPAFYEDRCDKAVIYIDKIHFCGVRELLNASYATLASSLDTRTPFFTKPLGLGIGLAEDPGGGQSFGLHRCGALAEGAVIAYERGQLSDRMAVVEEHLVSRGIDPSRPYLRAGSTDEYEVFARPLTMSGSAPFQSECILRKSQRARFLDTALEIGTTVAKSAYWDGNRCGWTGLDPIEGRHTVGTSRVAYCALGPEIYSGTSGIALFLSELATETGDPLIHRTALGAIQQAVNLSESLPLEMSTGLHSGKLGVALAAAYIGRLLDDDVAVDGARRIANKAAETHEQAVSSDLLAGDAGGIVSLLCLAYLLDEGVLIDIARRLGEKIIRAGINRSDQWCWPSTHSSDQVPLTGLSHGSAGIGFALLELYQTTGEREFREVAEGAFRYESQWYDPQQENWFDLRGIDGKRGVTAASRRCAVAWCHGAPGIALSRIRAYTMLKVEGYLEQALIALRTTKRWVEAMLDVPRANFSLCHGLSGNAAVLRYGTEKLAGFFPEGHHVARRVAQAGIHRHGTGQSPWPLEQTYAGSPSLMVGESGVGYFYLSMHEQTIPGVWLWTPDSLQSRLNHVHLR